MTSKIKVLIEDLDMNSFESMASIYIDLRNIKKEIEKQMEDIEDRTKYLLKDKKWENYTTPSKHHITLFKDKKEIINKKLLKMLLPADKVEKITRTTVKEKVTILSPKDKTRLKKYVN